MVSRHAPNGVSERMAKISILQVRYYNEGLLSWEYGVDTHKYLKGINIAL